MKSFSTNCASKFYEQISDIVDKKCLTYAVTQVLSSTLYILRKEKEVLNRNVLYDHEYVRMQDITENVNPTNNNSDVLSNKRICTDISSSKPKESVNIVGVSNLGNFDHSYSFSNVINILCINVCGLKSKLNSSDFIEECKDFDFIFLQEIKKPMN